MNNKDIANLKLEIHHFFDCEKEDETATREEIMEVIDRLKEIPIQPLSSADVVEVIRCENCEYGIENGELCGRKVYLCSAMTNPNEFYGDFFCANGERKEKE